MRKLINNTTNVYRVYKNRRLIVPMLKDALKGKFRLSTFTFLIILISIVYFLFPFDILPDFIPLIGWIDDGVLFYLLFLQLKKETARYAASRDKPSRPISLLKS